MDTEIIVTPTNPSEFEVFGRAVSLSGSIAVVGAPNDSYSPGPGAAYIFQLDAAGVTQIARLTASDGTPLDQFGSFVAIDGDYAVVCGSAPNLGGQAYIFHWDGSSWTEQAILTASGPAAMSGDSVIIGVHVFHRTGSNWVEEATLTSPAATPGNFNSSFGASVALHGDVAIVGDPSPGHHTTQPGEAYVFQRNGDAWIQRSPPLSASDATPGDHFGRSVAISGNYLVVGAPDANSLGVRCGGAYVFRRTGSSAWQPDSKLEPADPLQTVKTFGSSVALHDKYLVVGDPTDPYLDPTLPFWTTPGAGAAYVYRRRKVSDWPRVTPRLTAGDAYDPSDAFRDQFAYYGGSVAISPVGVLVGALGATSSLEAQGHAYFYPLRGLQCLRPR